MIIIQFNDFAYLAEGEHYMNEKQYLRANKRVFLAVTIIFAYITLTMLAALAASHGDHFVRIMIQCLVSVGVIILSALGYLTRKKTHTCAIILTTAMMVGYAAVALLNTTEGTWAYALPLIIAAMVYLNERLMKIINSVFLLVNIVRLMLSFAPHASAALANKVLALFVLLLVAYASISITRMLVLFFDENMTEITEAADKQKKNHDQMLLVAENISRHFEEAMTVLDSLENSIEVSHSSIQEIADSTESTAEAIQKQAVMCSNIQGNTDAAEAGIHQMIEAAHETDATVKSGAQVVLELKEQAQNVEEASNITVQVIQSLTSKVEEYAKRVPDSNGVYIVPAFAGMGAPYWNPYARGTIVGLTRGCKKEHFIRATLESIAYQAKDVIHAMEEDAGVTLNGLRVDGGASANNMLVQFQADIIDAAVLRPECIETTALGAAYLAGLAAGYWKDRDEIRENWQLGRRFEPVMDSGERKKLLRGWQRAVRCARLWAEDGE
jgi:methyl-accepting chemotaxis protein